MVKNRKYIHLRTMRTTTVVLLRLLLKVASLFLPEARQPCQEALPKPRGRCSM